MTDTSSTRARRKAVEQWQVEVTATQQIAGHLQRLTLRAPQFETYTITGPDEYFALLVPRQDPTERPALRWYSMRYLRPETGEVDVDIVLHGDSAPGTAFATHAKPGDVVDFRRGGSEYSLPEAGGKHLVVGDETSAPAVASIMEHAQNSTTCGDIYAVVEIPDESYFDQNSLHPNVVTLSRGDQTPGSLSIAHVEALTASDWTGAWLCGESKMSTTLRRFTVRSLGVDRKAVVFSGYWRHS